MQAFEKIGEIFMRHPIIGWERESPVPKNHVFNDFLSSRNGRLYLEGVDLAQVLVGGGVDQGLGRQLGSPLEIVYLPIIREKVRRMQQVFDEAIAEIGYPGRFHYAYASKANTAEEVVLAALQGGANYEMSSRTDVDIARIMKAAGLLTDDRMVIANGFKPEGSEYARNLIRLKAQHEKVIPVVDDLGELAPLIESGLSFDVGLRQKCYGKHHDESEMDATNSRFGLKLADMWAAADMINVAPNLDLKLYHAMVGSQITDEGAFVQRLLPTIDTYARLRQRHSSLSIFDFGGGVPAPLTLDFQFDYKTFARLLLRALGDVCHRHNVPPPDVMGEFGRYTATEQGAHLFKVVTVKENGSRYPWYIVDGSLMTSFPDTWALGEHFIVLPLNHLDKPFRRVQLGGITCDSDDVYPPKPSQSPLFLPVETRDLYIGFFSIGAYQEMLGGVRGTKHCSLPEATELIIDCDSVGKHRFHVMSGQSTEDVLRNLGYTPLSVKDG